MSEERPPEECPPDEPSGEELETANQRLDASERPTKRKMVVFTKDATDQEIADALNAMRLESLNDDA